MAWKVEPTEGWATVRLGRDGNITFEGWTISRDDGPEVENGDFKPMAVAILDHIRSTAAAA